MGRIIGSGAEANIYLDGSVVTKDRIRKSYRLFEIDEELRRFRTRREAKVLSKLSELKFPCPGLLSVCDKDMKIEMDYIDGDKLRDIFEKNPALYGREIGKLIAQLHSNDIIHGDLTTSNMICSNGQIFFIDFGLSFFSTKVEDKAVDLLLLRRAIESKHHTVFEDAFNSALESYYETFSGSSDVKDRFLKVIKRGRHKH